MLPDRHDRDDADQAVRRIQHEADEDQRDAQTAAESGDEAVLGVGEFLPRWRRLSTNLARFETYSTSLIAPERVAALEEVAARYAVAITPAMGPPQAVRSAARSMT